MFDQKKEKNSINKDLPQEYAFICFSSFEKRCLTIPMLIDRACVKKAYIIRNTDEISAKYNAENTKQITAQFECSEIIGVNLSKAISIAEAMTNIVGNLVKENEKKIVIDISTFTHEALLILMRLLYANRESFEVIKCLYNGASSYSCGDSPQNMWLSKGCRDVRNVIGYPGKLDSTKKKHVIVLTGFEIERATGLIELLAPEILTLGNGSEPTESEHSQIMEYFKEKFDSWKDNFVGMLTESFKFSCRDVKKTIDILEGITRGKEDNFLIIPLNTKLSTIAVGVVALKNPEIQVCYAVPEIYNMKNYSEPSNNVTIIDLDSLFE